MRTEAELVVRDATEADMAAVREIYNHAVRDTTAIWNEREVDLADRLAWRLARLALGYPVLVADCAGQVAGYASFGDFRAFEGYRHTAEHSVYVADGFRRRGIARSLLVALEHRARQIGKHVLIAGIEANNEASVRLHRELGFREVGLLPEVGIKFGRWLDLLFMQKILAAPDAG